jgi:hypothetical protein
LCDLLGLLLRGLAGLLFFFLCGLLFLGVQMLFAGLAFMERDLAR